MASGRLAVASPPCILTTMAPRQRTSIPAYERIAAGLRQAIAEGRLAGGTRLPSERELAAGHGVSLMTARRALVELDAQGLVTRRMGSGTYVAPASGGSRRLRDPHEEFAAPECRQRDGVRQWWAGGVLVVEERILLSQDGALGAKPLLEFLDGAAACASEEISASGDALRISQTIYGAGREVLATREMLVHGRGVNALLPRR